MIPQLPRFILSSLGFLLLAFVGQPLWTALHGTLVKLPPPTRSLTTASTPVGDAVPKSSMASSRSYGKLPIYFEPNVGQTDSQVKFIARGGGATTFLTATEAVFSLPIGDFKLPIEEMDDERPRNEVNFGLQAFDRGLLIDPPAKRNLKSPIGNRQSAITMRLVGTNPDAAIEGIDRLPGISNYFIGNDPAKWRTSVPQYAKVRYRDLYPGIDLVYYGNPQQFEYDFVVKPGGNPKQIQLAFQGAESLRVDEKGDLLIETSFGDDLRQRKPLVYQMRDQERLPVDARYVLDARLGVSFEVGSHDIARTLVIDPVLVYSTSFGGRFPYIEDRLSYMGEHVRGLAVDAQGNAYVAGLTVGTGFPVTSGAFQTEIMAESTPCFVAKLNATGSALMYATYLSADIRDIAVDTNAQAVVVGIAYSTDFPVTSGAFQTQPRGPVDGFVTKLNASGSALVYSSYLGGSRDDHVSSLALDSHGNAYVIGVTSSLDFPVTPGAFRTTSDSAGREDMLAYVTKLSPNGTTAVYSTYLGRAGLGDIAVDSAGAAYVVGASDAQDFPVSSNAFQKTLRGSYDTVAVKLNPIGTALEYSTFLGSTSSDGAAAVALDRDGSAYITGSTYGSDLPTTPGALDTTFQAYLGMGEPFVTKLNPTGSALAYSTFLNGTRSFGGSDIAVDSAGNAHILSRVFVSKLDAAGAVLRFSQSVVPTPEDSLVALALDPAGSIYVAGRTYSRLGTRTPAGNGIEPGVFPALVVKLSSNDTIPQFVPIVLSAAGLNGSFYTSELTLTNRSTNNAGLRFSYTAAFGEGSGIASDQLPAGQQKILPDALAYLRSIGIPIPASGNRGGTLRIDTPDGVFASVRTTNASASGRAGLSYASFPTMQGLTEPAYLYGLRQNERDRSNVAIQNLGGPSEGDILLRLTVYPGDPNSPARGLYEERLAPGGFRQITGILADRGLSFSQGFVSVERISGTAPYFAYGVVNDQATSDGSFVAPVLSYAMNGRSGFTIPAMVETSQFSSEMTLANSSGVKRTLQLEYRADAIQTADQTARLTLDLDPLQQFIIPDFVQFLRNKGVQGVEDTNTTYAGPLFVTAEAIDLPGVFVGAHTSTRRPGGRYGVLYSGVPIGTSSTRSAWLHGLRQDAENRTNLAIVNTGEVDTTDSQFEIEIYDGATGQKTATGPNVFVLVPAKSWRQIDNLLAQFAPGISQGYARVTKVTGSRQFSGSNRFITYAVVNDGKAPGERTGDGAFIASSP